MEDNSSSAIRVVRIILLVMIIVGIGLIVTRDMWVPKLVNNIISSETTLPIKQTPAPNATVSGVDGYATVGPTCPVVRIPADPACADKPYKTTLVLASTITGRNGGILIFTDERGYFTDDLSPGTYTIRAQSSAQLPRLSPILFTVVAGERLKLNLKFDSGIR